MESTYGDRLHDEKDPKEEIKEYIKKTIENEGVMMVPSFAVARAQLFLVYLHQIFEENPKLKIPVFVNSPMTNEVTDLYKKYNEEHKLTLDECDKHFSEAKFIEWSKDARKLDKKKGPMIIIAASGMVTGGRILHHLDVFGKHENNMVLLIGYQGEGTRGRELSEGNTKIELFGKMKEIKAQINHMHSLSAHADQKELLNWLKSFPEKPERVFLVHGEEKALEVLESKVRSELNINVEIASKNMVVNI